MPIKQKWLWQNPKKRGYMTTYSEPLCLLACVGIEYPLLLFLIDNLLGAHPDLT